MYAVPTGYNCITTSGGNQLTAYTNTSRDVYTLIGYDWVRTSHTTGSQNYSSLVCYTGEKLVPADIQIQFVLPATLILLAFFHVILNMFMGVRRR